MTTSKRLPANIEANAFHNHDEYAWQKKDLQQVLDYCIEAAIAILGGEAWVVRRIEDCGPDEPTEFQHNLDSQRRSKGSVLARSASHVVYGILPFRDGQMGVFHWDSRPRQTDQPWQEYVGATVANTARMIENGMLESEVIEEYSAHVYYNLVFELEDETFF